MTKRALISIFDKEGIIEFSKVLIEKGYEIISTGGTYKHLAKSGINAVRVEDITQFPEILGGRVKTLHPAVFAGILADMTNPQHTEELINHNLLNISLVVVNLYPFRETISKEGVTIDEAIEQIDIGGVSLIRAAAKNYKSVNVLVSPSQYNDYLSTENIDTEYSMNLAAKAFDYIADYDIYIRDYFAQKTKGLQPLKINIAGSTHLRYGENPHQQARFFKTDFDEKFQVLHGKEISYNNMLDIDAAMSLMEDFLGDEPTCAIVKHGNPCGVAVRGTLAEAYKRALQTDPASSFGGIIIFNQKLNLEAAQELDKLFSEIVIAPGFDDDVLEFLKHKKNRRIVKCRFGREKSELRKVAGGYLYQERDNMIYNDDELKVVTKSQPDAGMLKDSRFAYKIVKAVKSNAVVFVKDNATSGIGGGQPSRVDSTKIAVLKAKNAGIDLKGTVAASDAYFPFADGLLQVAEAGAVCVVQPGGSIRDQEVIDAADENKLVMIFTGYRHFKH